MAYTIPQVLQEIKRVNRMSDLSPTLFAEADGLADCFVRELDKAKERDKSKELKPTQLRKVFHQIKDMRRELRGEKYDRAKVSLVMPTLAYAVGRKLIPDEFYQLMKLCFGQERCREQQDFEAAADFLEAIMAYHKYYDGMKKNKEHKA